MAGGTFLTMNKKLPGAYINFKSVPAPKSVIGSRGIATMPLPLGWGEEGKVITLLSTDLEDGKSLAKVGVTAFDEESLILRECLKHCYKVHLFRVDTGGNKATATLGNLTATAKYAGTKGNHIQIVIKKNNTKYDVITLWKSQEKDLQTVAKVEDLIANPFVDFSGTGVLAINAGTTLENGTNGAVTKEKYAPYLEAMKTVDYQVMGIVSADAALAPIIADYVKGQRDRSGKKVQAVVYNYNAANHEGIISTKQGYKTALQTIEPVNFVATVTGMTAGANINQSNCYKIIEAATEIIGDLPEDELEQEIQKGWFLLTKRVDGVIVVLDDINTFTDYSSEKDRDFGNNRVIRVFDEIGNTTRLIFEKYYIGKENNDATGRDTFKAQLVANFRELQNLRAIQNFKSEDITVVMGQEKDEVKVDGYIQPTDAMKKLYMTIYER